MTNAQKQADDIAELKRKLVMLEEAVKPKPIPSEQDVAEHRDWMHQLSERRMSNAACFSPEDRRAMEAACPTSAVKDIVSKGGIPGPSGAGVSGKVEKVSSNVGLIGSNTGYVPQFGANGQHPTPGINQVDRVAEGFAHRERLGKR